MSETNNQVVAEKLRQMADLLSQQGANPFRVTAYRNAARTVDKIDRDLAQIVAEDGRAGLEALPGIGSSISASIIEILRSGRWVQLDRLRGRLDPEHLLQTVPGIGPALAQRIHDELHIDTLEQLEVAAHDGRLDTVPGIGERSLRAIRASLHSMLDRTTRTRSTPRHVPDVGLLLEIDNSYRKQAKAGKLPTIAPKRFNPKGVSWLPVMHEDHNDWHFTALFSNTDRAHKLHRTDDWVVIYFQHHDQAEGQHTVVTETRGSLIGERVVRGRELECAQWYKNQARRVRSTHA